MPQAAQPLARDVATRLQTTHFGRAMRSFSEVTSTNSLAGAWALEGAAEGSLVLADYQRAGRGRLGRSWTATRGANLLFSLVLRPPLAPDAWGRIGMAAALAVAESLQPLTSGLPVRIKWPNDVLLDGHKCCGMLLEASYPVTASEATRRFGAPGSAVVLGIGLNVNERCLPESLEGRATSLLLSTGRLHDRAALLARLLAHLERTYTLALDVSDETLVAQYEAYLDSLGAMVTLYPTMQSSECAIQGTLLGVEATGGLKLQTHEGLRVVHSGDVTSRPSAALS